MYSLYWLKEQITKVHNPTWDKETVLSMSVLVRLKPGSLSARTFIVFLPMNSRASRPPVKTLLPCQWDNCTRLGFHVLLFLGSQHLLDCTIFKYEKQYKVTVFSHQEIYHPFNPIFFSVEERMSYNFVGHAMLLNKDA